MAGGLVAWLVVTGHGVWFPFVFDLGEAVVAHVIQGTHLDMYM